MIKATEFTWSAGKASGTLDIIEMSELSHDSEKLCIVLMGSESSDAFIAQCSELDKIEISLLWRSAICKIRIASPDPIGDGYRVELDVQSVEFQ